MNTLATRGFAKEKRVAGQHQTNNGQKKLASFFPEKQARATQLGHSLLFFLEKHLDRCVVELSPWQSTPSTTPPPPGPSPPSIRSIPLATRETNERNPVFFFLLLSLLVCLPSLPFFPVSLFCYGPLVNGPLPKPTTTSPGVGWVSTTFFHLLPKVILKQEAAFQHQYPRGGLPPKPTLL